MALTFLPGYRASPCLARSPQKMWAHILPVEESGLIDVLDCRYKEFVGRIHSFHRDDPEWSKRPDDTKNLFALHKINSTHIKNTIFFLKQSSPSPLSSNTSLNNSGIGDYDFWFGLARIRSLLFHIRYSLHSFNNLAWLGLRYWDIRGRHYTYQKRHGHHPTRKSLQKWWRTANRWYSSQHWPWTVDHVCCVLSWNSHLQKIEKRLKNEFDNWPANFSP